MNICTNEFFFIFSSENENGESNANNSNEDELIHNGNQEQTTDNVLDVQGNGNETLERYAHNHQHYFPFLC